MKDAVCYKKWSSVRREQSKQRGKPGKLVGVILGVIVFACLFAWSTKMSVMPSLTLDPALALVEKAAARRVVWRRQASIGSIGGKRGTGPQMAGARSNWPRDRTRETL